MAQPLLCSDAIWPKNTQDRKATMNKLPVALLMDGVLEKLMATKIWLIGKCTMAGVVGSVLVIFFISTFLTPPAALRLMPLVVGFNAAMAGFMLVERSGRRFRRPVAVAAVSGGVLAVLVCLLATLAWPTVVAAIVNEPAEMMLPVALGIISGTLGALLAQKVIQIELKTRAGQ
jgi:hypothetical protein